MSDAFPPAADPATVALRLETAEATARLARWLAPRLGPGDVLLLSGQIGAGKTHFARALIQARLAAAGRREDVPSPTFTLVQSYDDGAAEIWHADLYRLTHPDEAAELGLEEAFDTALCLVEWPDRLADLAPHGALALDFAPEPAGEARRLALRWATPRWTPLAAAAAAKDWNREEPEA